MKTEQPTMLLQFEPEKFWGQMRAIIKEELAGDQQQKRAEDEGEHFLPRKEVAKLLRVSLVTLNSWVKKGLPAHKQHGKVYFLHSEVLHYIKSRTR